MEKLSEYTRPRPESQGYEFTEEKEKVSIKEAINVHNNNNVKQWRVINWSDDTQNHLTDTSVNSSSGF